jgi:uncharacterized protein (DUF934 family)
MPRLIKDGTIVEDSWLPVQPESEVAGDGHVCTLAQWRQLDDRTGSAVQVEPGEGVQDLLENLEDIALVVVNFPAFADGRGFSYGRELRERGYRGELRAHGNFMRDQMAYLQRVGFDAFALAEESELEGALHSLSDFSEFYQASIDQPQPLFRRR